MDNLEPRLQRELLALKYLPANREVARIRQLLLDCRSALRKADEAYSEAGIDSALGQCFWLSRTRRGRFKVASDIIISSLTSAANEVVRLREDREALTAYLKRFVSDKEIAEHVNRSQRESQERRPTASVPDA